MSVAVPAAPDGRLSFTVTADACDFVESICLSDCVSCAEAVMTRTKAAQNAASAKRVLFILTVTRFPAQESKPRQPSEDKLRRAIPESVICGQSTIPNWDVIRPAHSLCFCMLRAAWLKTADRTSLKVLIYCPQSSGLQFGILNCRLRSQSIRGVKTSRKCVTTGLGLNENIRGASLNSIQTEDRK